MSLLNKPHISSHSLWNVFIIVTKNSGEFHVMPVCGVHTRGYQFDMQVMANFKYSGTYRIWLSPAIWTASVHKCYNIQPYFTDLSVTKSDHFHCVKVRSHMCGADAGGGGRKIGFNTNHYMRSHIRVRGAEAEREQNPLRNKWVQHPIFRVRFETARSKPSVSSINARSARVRSAYVWTYPR